MRVFYAHKATTAVHSFRYLLNQESQPSVMMYQLSSKIPVILLFERISQRLKNVVGFWLSLSNLWKQKRLRVIIKNFIVLQTLKGFTNPQQNVCGIQIRL